MFETVRFPAKLLIKKIRTPFYLCSNRVRHYRGELWETRELNILASKRCNARCPHCYLLQADGNVFKDEDISLASVEKLLDRYKNFGRISLSGGEALLNPEIMDIIDACLRRGKEVQLLTNGISLVKHGETLSHLPLENLHVSVDATTSEEFAGKRGLKGLEGKNLFDKMTKAIRSMAGERPKKINSFGVSFIVDHNNYKRMASYIEFAESLGVDYVWLTNYHAVSEDTDDLPLFSHDEVLSEMRVIMERTDYALNVNLPVLYDRNPRSFCYSLFTQVTMDPRGNVSPCCHKDPSGAYGNLFVGKSAAEDALDLPWNSKAVRKFRYSFLAGKKMPPECLYCKNRFRFFYTFKKENRKWYRNQQY